MISRKFSRSTCRVPGLRIESLEFVESIESVECIEPCSHAESTSPSARRVAMSTISLPSTGS
jgi:hypothetical protein